VAQLMEVGMAIELGAVFKLLLPKAAGLDALTSTAGGVVAVWLVLGERGLFERLARRPPLQSLRRRACTGLVGSAVIMLTWGTDWLLALAVAAGGLVIAAALVEWASSRGRSVSATQADK
jgi:hypothetical protein